MTTDEWESVIKAAKRANAQEETRKIVHHDERATAHQNLVQEMRRQNADLRGSVRELRELVDELATQVRQPRRRR